MSERAVMYARVSGDDRDKEGRNLAGQLEMGREYAQAHGYTVVAELSEDDRGASGYEINLPKLNRVREMAAAGSFDVLVVRELDRLSRNLAKQLIVEEELKRHGVRVEYVLAEYPDTPEGNLQKHVKAVIAEYEREKIKERMVRGRRLKAKAGHVITHGRAPFGYKLTEVDGKRTLAIHDPEARIVRLIFQWYTEGDGEDGSLSLIQIAERLTEMRVPTQGDTDDRIAKQRGYGEWNRTAIRKMLKRETYAGVFHYGKVNKNDTGRTVKNPRETWIPVEVPAIVPREVWEAAQRQLKENRETARRNLKYDYLLRTRVSCASCGASMCGKTVNPNGKPYSYYICGAASGRLDYARNCEQTTWFRSDHVDAATWEWVKSFLLDPASLRVGLEEYQAERDRANTPLHERLAVVEDLMADNQHKLEKLLELYLAGDFPKELLIERKGRLEDTIGKLEKERKALVAQLETQTLTDEQVECLEDFALRITEGLELANEDFETQQKVIEMLDVRATLAIEDGKQVAYLRCMLGEDNLSIERTNIYHVPGEDAEESLGKEQQQAPLAEQPAGDLPIEAVDADLLQARQLWFAHPPGDLAYSEEDDRRQHDAQGASQVEHCAPADHVAQGRGQDHPQHVAYGRGKLQQTVNFPAHGGTEVVRDQAVQAGVAGVVNASRGSGEQERRIGGSDGAEPGGGAPDERGQRQQFGPGVAVVQVAPQRIENSPHDQRPRKHRPHLGLVDPESLHDGGGQGTDEQLVGLVQKHKGEENRDHEPAVAGPARDRLYFWPSDTGTLV